MASVGAVGSNVSTVKVGPPIHNYEHEAGSYGDGFTYATGHCFSLLGH